MTEQVKETTTRSTRKQRPQRTPVGIRGRLNVRNKDPNYEYRVVNDENGRVHTFEDAGYEVVQGGNESIGDSRLNQPSAEGSVVQAHVGNGVKGVLMRIPKDWYNEDQHAKRVFIDEKERTITNKQDGGYGRVETSYS